MAPPVIIYTLLSIYPCTISSAALECRRPHSSFFHIQLQTVGLFLQHMLQMNPIYTHSCKHHWRTCRQSTGTPSSPVDTMQRQSQLGPHQLVISPIVGTPRATCLYHVRDFLCWDPHPILNRSLHEQVFITDNWLMIQNCRRSLPASLLSRLQFP